MCEGDGKIPLDVIQYDAGGRRICRVVVLEEKSTVSVIETSTKPFEIPPARGGCIYATAPNLVALYGIEVLSYSTVNPQLTPQDTSIP